MSLTLSDDGTTANSYSVALPTTPATQFAITAYAVSQNTVLLAGYLAFVFPGVILHIVCIYKAYSDILSRPTPNKEAPERTLEKFISAPIPALSQD